MFPFVVIFLVPSIAIATVYAFRLPKYYAFSLLLFSITYALPVFLYLVVRHFDRFFHSLFLSIAGMGFFGLFLFVSLRISADRNLDHRR
ncbi:MAG TPA: hypothetical protein PK765_01125 [bacterium]|nr:hypothetical protein [bacterium]